MKTIKIKVKHLLLIIAAVPILLLALPRGYLLVADSLAGSRPELSASMYQKYIAYVPFAPAKDRAVFSLALKSFDIKGGSYFEKLATDGSAMSASYISREMLNTSIYLYKSIIDDYKKSRYYEKAYNNLLYIYTYAADIKSGEKLITLGEASENKQVKLTAQKYRMYYLMASRKYSKALDLGSLLLKEYDKDRDLYKLMSDTCLLQGDYDKAAYYCEKSKISRTANYNSGIYTMFLDYNSLDSISTIKTLKAESAATAVKGRVTVLGKGIPFARVYLKTPDDNGMYSGEENEPYYGITDAYGNYSIAGAPMGFYRLMVVIPGVLINNTVLKEYSGSTIRLNTSRQASYNFDFVRPLNIKAPHILKPKSGYVDLSWEPVKKAAYYIVNIIQFIDPEKGNRSSYHISISDEITESSYKLSLEDANIRLAGYSVSEDGRLNPQAYLGSFYPGCRVPIYITAYDKRGLLITSSLPNIVMYDNIPVITTEKKSLSEAEKLLLERRPEKAMKLLEEELKKAPDNIRAMSILSNIYTRGTRVYHAYTMDPKAQGQNLNKALDLNTRLYQLTGNVKYVTRNEYIYECELRDYQKLLKSYETIPKSEFKASDYINLGELYLRLGNLEAASLSFKKSYASMTLSYYSSLSPILLDLYNKDFNSALRDLDRTSLRLWRVSSEALKEDIISLKGFNTNTSEYESFRKLVKYLLEHKFEAVNNDEYRKLKLDIKSEPLKDITDQALGNYRIILK